MVIRYRTLANEYRYMRRRKSRAGSKGCPFCEITSKSEQLLRETEYFKIVHNIFPYNKWDGSKVIDHLMIVPKEHTDSLNTLTPEAMQEFVKDISKYESMGYDVFARSPQSTIKSIVHQHTHLIKTTKTSSN